MSTRPLREGESHASVITDVLSGLAYLGVTALLYHLLKPGGRALSFTAAVFGTAGVPIGGVAFLAHMTPIVLLKGDPYLGAFTASQLQAAALLALKLRAQMFAVGMMLFGVQIFLLGRLIVRSTLLPRGLGLLLSAAGPIYVLGALATLQLPAAGAVLMPLTMAAAFVAEGSLTAWLLVKGVAEA